MKLRVLMTGGAGYVGSVACEHLLNAGYHVTVIDKLVHPQSNLSHLSYNKNFEFVNGDVRDKKVMKDILYEADVIFPLASLVGAPACSKDPKLAKSVNLESIELLMTLRNKYQLVIFPTTNSGYMTKADGDLYCDEKTPLTPASVYGKTKSEAEKLILEEPNTMSLRLATVFGMSPCMRLDSLVNNFVYLAVTQGYIVIFEKDLKRNYVHVRDVADCFIHCIEHAGSMIGEAYNCGIEEINYSKAELAKKIKEYIPKFYAHYAEIGSDLDKRNYSVSNEKLKAMGFEARRSLDEGIPELIKGLSMIRL